MSLPVTLPGWRCCRLTSELHCSPMSSPSSLTSAPPPRPVADRLLTVKEAADKLGCSPDALYKNKRHPCRVQNGRSVRFSEKAIEATIRRQLRAQG
jgi:predicted DNA-binding transcriptional regulator AlpA